MCFRHSVARLYIFTINKNVFLNEDAPEKAIINKNKQTEKI